MSRGVQYAVVAGFIAVAAGTTGSNRYLVMRAAGLRRRHRQIGHRDSHGQPAKAADEYPLR